MKTTIILASIALALAIAEPAFAWCSCNNPAMTPAAAHDEAELVFVGTAVAIDRTNELVLVTFRVQTHGKNSARDLVTITTGPGESSCGYPFEVGRQYFVYARAIGDRFETDLCHRTAPIAWALDDLRELRKRAP